VLGPDATNNFAAVRKSQQTGVSIGGIALCGAYIDRAPCRIGYALPTIDLLREFNREKLAISIASTPVLKRKVRAPSSRSAEGSTVDNKRYPGGSLSLINGNSAADLKSRTLKVGIADEVDAWPDEVGDEGDPLDLFKGRFVAFHATGDWRLLAISTPQLLGSSRIDALFKAGDQRFWNVPAPAAAMRSSC
jgi:phage terminase large subunit GpA-like protein